MPKISVYRGRNHLFDHWIEKVEVVIGRSADADIPLDSPAASRRHCKISRRQGSYFLEELGAKNGLFVNGQFCNVKRLEDGDQIEIADHTLRFSRPRSERRRERAIDSGVAGAAFRIQHSEIDKMMSGKADSGAVRSDLRTANPKATTAVSPEELNRLMKEMETKLKAHLEVLSAEGSHVRHALDAASYMIGFTEACEIRLGDRVWPSGRLAAKVQQLPDKSHKLIRLSKWVSIKVGGSKLVGVHILADKEIVEVGGVKLRYLARSEIAR